MTAPRATLRLQLHRDFTFADAERLVPYLAALGVSHLYSSPIFTARPGSMHGYDVTDPTTINPELGGEAGFRSLVRALRQAGLGLIVDIVPNHMAADTTHNRWWRDVLANGPGSAYATTYDIDWQSTDPALRDKVLAPFLGVPYGEAFGAGEITLTQGEDGAPAIRYYDDSYPLRPEDHAGVIAAGLSAHDPGTAAGRHKLSELLERQHYRLAWWRTAGDEINWRRFFDINGLAGVRVEDPAVFEATHATLFRLYGEGLIDGVRVDHVDGLSDPAGYCRRLRARLHELRPDHHAWFIVEKIIGAGETLATDWQVDGTSGYDFMNSVNALAHDPAGEATLTTLWTKMSGRPAEFETEEVAARREILDSSFTSQLGALVDTLHRAARQRIETRDLTWAAIRRAVAALLTQFRVYRTYGNGPRSANDAAAFRHALAAASESCRAAERPLLAQIDRWLTDPELSDAARRFQQLSAPLAAKAVEDTAFYRYGRLLSRNDVGFDPARFSAPPSAFHADAAARGRHFPTAMLATATHDHKRGEDMRARLAVLSEVAGDWAAAVRRWHDLNAPHRRSGAQGDMPSPGDELMLYQTIVGAWPLTLAVDDRAGREAFIERVAGWQQKALREAKLATDWLAPDLDYEDAARSFLYTVLGEPSDFLTEIAAFAHRIGPAGALNGLSQALLKLTAPGVPDFFQGSEFWDLSLVDPDNRRPVVWQERIGALEDASAVADLAQQWRDGRVKQALIRRALRLRADQPALFVGGDYEPLAVRGASAERVTAFLRRSASACAIVLAPRLTTPLLPGGDGILIPAQAWDDTRIDLPSDLAAATLRDLLSDGELRLSGRTLLVAQAFARLPLALLTPA